MKKNRSFLPPCITSRFSSPFFTLKEIQALLKAREEVAADVRNYWELIAMVGGWGDYWEQVRICYDEKKLLSMVRTYWAVCTELLGK